MTRVFFASGIAFAINFAERPYAGNHRMGDDARV